MPCAHKRHFGAWCSTWAYRGGSRSVLHGWGRTVDDDFADEDAADGASIGNKVESALQSGQAPGDGRPPPGKERAPGQRAVQRPYQHPSRHHLQPRKRIMKPPPSRAAGTRLAQAVETSQKRQVTSPNSNAAHHTGGCQLRLNLSAHQLSHRGWKDRQPCLGNGRCKGSSSNALVHEADQEHIPAEVHDAGQGCGQQGRHGVHGRQEERLRHEDQESGRQAQAPAQLRSIGQPA